MIIFAIAVSAFALIGWVYLGFFHGGFWQLIFDEPAPEPEKWPSIDIIVPARNEADILPQSLSSLLQQDYPGIWRIILVDDHSTDGTGATARKLADDQNKTDRLTIINAPDLPAGWAGKVAAMQAGTAHSTADYILFTDADIGHPPDSLRRLAAKAVERNIDLVSRMVKLNCTTTAEKLLIPAFVFFFAMLYPFQQANDEDSEVAAAAGGVMLVCRKALDRIGGLAAIKSALIDDCSLAKAIKLHGGEKETPVRIELTLTRDIKSLRPYPALRDIHRMVARSAFTQLNYSYPKLAGTIFGMGILFLAPVLFALTGLPMASEMAMAACIIMLLIYVPMVQFYDLSPLWVFALPLAALLYMVATIDSCRLHWQGKGGQWKGRTQA